MTWTGRVWIIDKNSLRRWFATSRIFEGDALLRIGRWSARKRRRSKSIPLRINKHKMNYGRPVVNASWQQNETARIDDAYFFLSIYTSTFPVSFFFSYLHNGNKRTIGKERKNLTLGNRSLIGNNHFSFGIGSLFRRRRSPRRSRTAKRFWNSYVGGNFSQ